jgi:hypothetical protein
VTKIVQPAYDVVFEGNEARSELAKLLWQETVAALKDADAVSAPNLARSDRYVRARVEFEDLHKIAAEEGPVLKGAEGGEYFNYRWSACEKLGDRLMKLEKAIFGEATVSGGKEKPASGASAADEFLGSNN